MSRRDTLFFAFGFLSASAIYGAGLIVSSVRSLARLRHFDTVRRIRQGNYSKPRPSAP